MATSLKNLSVFLKRTASKPFKLWNHDTSADSPIERCISDILVAVFQVLVDDEAARCFSTDPLSRFRRRMPVTLALVCRRWKELIYGTASLWAVVFIDGSIQDDRLVIDQQLMNHRIHMAKGTAVDLHILNFPAYCEHPRHIRSLLCSVPNLVRLRMVLSARGTTRDSPLLMGAWPELHRLQELYYHANQDSVFTMDVETHFSGMPRLTSLRLSLAQAIFSLPYYNRNGRPLFPLLKVLVIRGVVDRRQSARGEQHLTMIPQFLSHCPRIQEVQLDLFITGIHPSSNQLLDDMPSINLAQLTKMAISGVAALLPFATLQVISPALRELSLCEWQNRCAGGIFAFLSSTPGITRLSTSATDSNLRLLLKLVPFPQLKTLSIFSYAHGECLTTLCIPIGDNVELSQACCPSLKSLCLMLGRSMLHPEYFTKFAVARCIPINKERATVAGYAALDHLFLGLPCHEDPLVAVKGSAAWRRAVVREKSPTTLLLRWEYEPPSSSWINVIRSHSKHQGLGVSHFLIYHSDVKSMQV